MNLVLVPFSEPAAPEPRPCLPPAVDRPPLALGEGCGRPLGVRPADGRDRPRHPADRRDDDGRPVRGAAKVCAASMRGRPVIPHVFPEIHVHLAAAFPIVSAVELTLPEYEIEGLYRLFREWVTIEDGQLVAPTGPGLGFVLDPQAVDRYTVESTHLGV